MTKTTYDHLAIEADALAERQLHGRVLAAGTFTSVGCNVWHALITGSNGPLGAAGAAVIALIAPLCLLVGTHSLLMHLWARNPFATWFDHAIKAFSALIFLGVSACAFAISFHGLRDIAEMSQIMPGIAGLFPLMLDGLLVVSGVCLLASVRLQSGAHRAQQYATPDHVASPADIPPLQGHTPSLDQSLVVDDNDRTETAATEDISVEPLVARVTHVPVIDKDAVPEIIQGLETPDPEIVEPAEPEPPAAAADTIEELPVPAPPSTAGFTDADRYAALARRIQNGRSDISPSSIAEALRLVDTGSTHREAADIIGVDRSTVSRWYDKAKAVRLDQPELITTT